MFPKHLRFWDKICLNFKVLSQKMSQNVKRVGKTVAAAEPLSSPYRPCRWLSIYDRVHLLRPFFSNF